MLLNFTVMNKIKLIRKILFWTANAKFRLNPFTISELIYSDKRISIHSLHIIARTIRSLHTINYLL
jgi:hypothetical protein